MQNKIKNILIIAQAVALITAAGTCQQTRHAWERKTQEAREEAQFWESTAGAYAEALERAEAARRRAEQSTMYYLKEVKKTEGRTRNAEKMVEQMRKDGSDCGWLDTRLPDGVRDALGAIHALDGRPGNEAAGNAAGAVRQAGTSDGRD